MALKGRQFPSWARGQVACCCICVNTGAFEQELCSCVCVFTNTRPCIQQQHHYTAGRVCECVCASVCACVCLESVGKHRCNWQRDTAPLTHIHHTYTTHTLHIHYTSTTRIHTANTDSSYFSFPLTRFSLSLSRSSTIQSSKLHFLVQAFYSPHSATVFPISLIISFLFPNFISSSGSFHFLEVLKTFFHNYEYLSRISLPISHVI